MVAHEMSVLYDEHFSTLYKNKNKLENLSIGYLRDHSFSVAQNPK
jgi:hypothetical protein